MYTKAKDNILLIDVQGWCRTRQEAIEASGAKENGEVATEDALRLKPAPLPLRTHTYTHTHTNIHTHTHTHTRTLTGLHKHIQSHTYTALCTHIHRFVYTHTVKRYFATLLVGYFPVQETSYATIWLVSTEDLFAIHSVI